MSEQAPIFIPRVYAGFVTRAIALTVDLIVVSALVAANAFVAQLVGEVFPLDRLTTLLLNVYTALLSLGIGLLYPILFWMLAGRTPGKALMGIRVVHLREGSIGAGSASLRLVGYAVSAILFLGFLWVLVDPRRQAFHDKLADTVVVHDFPQLRPILPNTAVAKIPTKQKSH